MKTVWGVDLTMAFRIPRMSIFVNVKISYVRES